MAQAGAAPAAARGGATSSLALGALTSARQLAFAGDVAGALALLAERLAEDDAQPRLWLLLGDLLAGGGAEGWGSAAVLACSAPAPAAPRGNPSGLGSRGAGRPRDAAGAAEAYASACSHGRRLGERAVVDAARENLQRLLRNGLGHSPSLVLEGLWDGPRGRFIAAEARQAASALRKRVPNGRIAACVLEGAGWEAVWLARHADTLGLLRVFSVRGPRTAAVLPFERSLAEANAVMVVCLSSEDLGAHIEAARPDALLLLLGSCLGPFALPPAAVLAEVVQLHAVAGQTPDGGCVPAAFVPARVSWRGGAAAGPALRGVSQVDAGQMRAVGLDYSLAAEAMRPSHAWVPLGEGGAEWEEGPLASLCLEEAWAGAASGKRVEECLEAMLRLEAEGPAARAARTPSPDAFVWWTRAEAGCTDASADAATSSSEVSCAPCSGPPRTWQVAVFGEKPESRSVKELLAAAASPARFRGYHVGMLNDQSRTAYYDAALREAVTSWPVGKPLVGLDIGSGTGLLALLLAKHALAAGIPAARAQIAAVEAEGELASVAGRLAAANGMDGILTVHNTLSTQLGPGLPAVHDAEGATTKNGSCVRANICVHEVFGSDPLSERVLPSLRHARQELLTADCRLVPRRIRILCALCCGKALRCAFLPPSSVQGVRCLGEAFADLAPVVEAMAVPSSERPSAEVAAAPEGDEGSSAPPIAWLTEQQEAAVLDLLELPTEVPLELEVKLRGPLGADELDASGGVFIASWFSLEGPVPMDTGPEAGRGMGSARPWAPVFQRLPGCELATGGAPFEAEVSVAVAEDRIRYRLLRVALEDEEERATELAPLFEEDA